MLKRTLCLSLLLLAPLQGRDLGVMGPVFEIREKSLLEIIQERLQALAQSSKLKSHQKEIQERVKNSILNPSPIPGITKATETSSHTYDPSILLDEDIKDHKGTVISAKGTKINPLDYHSFGKPLLLIQGEDQEQVSWALKQDAKIVLVSGKPLHLSKRHQTRFYYDQGGILIQKFGIKAVPVRISQQGKALRIEQLYL